MEKLGESAMYVHARPIWHRDEERLIAATSFCDQGLQERAIIRTVIRTGGRASDVRKVSIDIISRRRWINIISLLSN
jgi:hypothetical protein